MIENQCFQSKKEIENWLDNMKVKNYTINDDLTVDVKGTVDLENKGLIYLPLQFGTVRGNFLIGSNYLTSLLGSPFEVYGDVEIQHNKITSLEHISLATGSYFLSHNNITSLKGLPTIIHKDLRCSSNELKNLEFGPKEIKGLCDYSRNKINTLEFCPEIVASGLKLIVNKITKINIPKLTTSTLYLNGNPIKQLEYKDIENINIEKTLSIDEMFINKKGTLSLKNAVLRTMTQNERGDNVSLIDFNQFKEQTMREYEKVLLEKTLVDNKKTSKIKL